MSFLNPVNEPVLRFSSTDTDAPQINYNARTAGDVKAVLKACLVTGYGTTASAGWSVVNEAGNVAEFVSPSAAMSDYRLGIDDTSTSSTTWYYQYQDVRVNPQRNNPTKAFVNIEKTNPANGWQLFVTDRGFLFVELVQHSAINKLSARLTYFGAIKSALKDNTGENICFFNVGHNQVWRNPNYFYDDLTVTHVHLADYTSVIPSAATSNILTSAITLLDIANVDLVSPIYIATGTKDLLLAELPPMLSKLVNKTDDVYGIADTILDGRNVFSVCAGFSFSSLDRVYSDARTFLIRTDYWEY